MADLELEAQLREAGNRLLKPPSSVEELLPLLDHLESCLSKVEQSPPDSMQKALLPSLKVLVSEEIMGHSDVDVKVAVASCVSEVTRITAPDAPYEDEKMKEIFKVIVAAFEKLCDTSSRSYSKRVSILETVAKVRSCVVMLDLECDALILKMFQHFLKSIRDFHEDTVYSSMETIMTLVLEESEDIQPELLSALLDSVKKDNQDVLPIARRLAEKVLSNCAAKLKPYLMQSVKSMGLSLDDYTGTVTAICEETPDSTQPSDGNASGEHLVDESKLNVKADPDKPPQVVKKQEPESACTHEIDPVVKNSPKSIMSNGNAKTEHDDSLVGVDSPKEKPEVSDPVTQSAECEPNSLDAQLVKSETKSDQSTKKKRGRKPNSVKQTAETSGHSHVDGDKENSDLPDDRKGHGKVINSTLAEDQTVGEVTIPSGNGKESLSQVSTSSVSRDQSGKLSSPSPIQSTPDGIRPKRGRPARTKKENMDEDTDSGLPSVGKGAESNDQNEVREPNSANVLSKKKQGGNSELEAKHQRLGKKSTSRNTNDELVSPHTDAAKKDSSAMSDSEAKPQKRSGKKVDAKNSNENESSGKKEGGKTKRGRGTIASEKDESEDIIIKKKLSSPKSTSKSIDTNQSHLQETTKTGSKRKRSSGREEHSDEDFDENLVGSEIKVWWPRDKTFYVGTVVSFDPVKKKHKVVYTDGDKEELVLKKEKWELVEEAAPDEKQTTNLPSPDASEPSRKKKLKTSADSPMKQTKSDAKGKGASSTKSKGESSSKSGGKAKDDGKLSTKNMEDTSKSASKSKSDSTGKSKDNTLKSGNKSKDSSSKSGAKSKEGGKSKDDTPKAEAKSKEDKVKAGSSTPKKAGSKSRANGTSAKGKPSASKNVHESEESTKGSTKSGKREIEESTKGKGLDSGDGKGGSGKKRRKVTG